jgi:hypothetical protein
VTPAFEAFLARLYVEEDVRVRFLADPEGEALRAGLDQAQAAALARIDRTGLRMAAVSFAAKRSRHRETPGSA